MIYKHRHLALRIALPLLFIVQCSLGGLDEAAQDYMSATFEVEGNTAFMNGVIDGTTPGEVRDLIEDYPEVRRIVMENVDGSDDDEANLRAARRVREHGFHTHVPADGLIASGGTDFFIAGTTRTVENGGRVGVHSWAAGDDTEGADLPDDHPDHEPYLDYYWEMGIPEDFYWFTLDAAPSSDMHWMTQEELAHYEIVTE